jgi:prepilin-type processing-associated H-X9-DG protein
MKSPRTSPISAFTLIDLLITIACVLLVAAFLLPILAKRMATASKINCTNCLKQVGLSFRSWAIDNNDCLPMQVSITNGGTMELVSSGLVFPHFLAMSNELNTPKTLACPADKGRSFAAKFDANLKDTNLSYFINVDSTQADSSSLLCGDRNLTNKAPAGSHFVPLFGTSVIGWTSEIHGEKGNLCFADGSVNGFTNGAVGLALHMPDGVTNRLAVP